MKTYNLTLIDDEVGTALTLEEQGGTEQILFDYNHKEISIVKVTMDGKILTNLDNDVSAVVYNDLYKYAMDNDTITKEKLLEFESME